MMNQNPTLYLVLGVGALVGVLGWMAWLPLIIVGIVALALSTYLAYRETNKGRHILAVAAGGLTLMGVILFFTRVLEKLPEGNAVETFGAFMALLLLAVLVVTIVGVLVAFRSAKAATANA